MISDLEGDQRPRDAFRCPSCRKPVRRGAEDFPFCSRRCRDVDLGQWFLGGYRISRPLVDPDELDAAELPDTTEDDT